MAWKIGLAMAGATAVALSSSIARAPVTLLSTSGSSMNDAFSGGTSAFTGTSEPAKFFERYRPSIDRGVLEQCLADAHVNPPTSRPGTTPV